MKVLSIEQMTKLKELGVDTSKASVRVGQMVFKHGDPWYGKEEYDVFLLDHEDNDTQCFNESYRAFSLQDVIELLPKRIKDYDLNWYITDMIFRYDRLKEPFGYESDVLDGASFSFNENVDIIEVAYNMLIWVIENGYLKTK